MGGIAQFRCQVLPRPMLIMPAIAPETAIRYIIYDSFVCDPDIRLVLTIAKRKLL